MSVRYNIQQKNILVYYTDSEGKFQTKEIEKRTKKGIAALDLIRDGKEGELPELLEGKRKLNHPALEESGGKYFIDGKEVNDALLGKLRTFLEDELSIDPLVNFHRKLMKSTSFTVRKQLYRFLEDNNHPFTADGNFVAYKAVRNNFMDKHSGTFRNRPGDVPEMDRGEVNEDPDQLCSHGLHVASYVYAEGFMCGDDILVEVEVDPADVVAVPKDYNNTKMRTCRYKVIGICEGEEHADGEYLSPEEAESKIASHENEMGYGESLNHE